MIQVREQRFATRRTRKVRVLKGGILITGKAEPPVRPYGNNNDGRGPTVGHGGTGMLSVPAGVKGMPSIDLISHPERVSFA
jgi:hypothetical protein